MMINRRGEQMVEAAFILPLLILMIVSLLLLAVFYYEVHCRQIDCHASLHQQWDQNRDMLSVGRDHVTVTKKMQGLADRIMKERSEHRIYRLRPAQWICLGEMMSLDE